MCCVFLGDGWAWLSRIAFGVTIIGCFIISGYKKGDVSVLLVSKVCAPNGLFARSRFSKSLFCVIL